MSNKSDVTHIPENEATAVLLFMEQCFIVLRIAHWKCILSPKPADDDNHAEMDVVPGRHVMTLYLPPCWMEKSTEEKRHTLMHESLHVIHGQQEQMLRKMFEKNGQMSKDMRKMIMRAYLEESEYMVDRLTVVFETEGIVPRWPTAAKVRAAVKDRLDSGSP